MSDDRTPQGASPDSPTQGAAPQAAPPPSGPPTRGRRSLRGVASLRTEGVRQTSLVGNLVLVSYLAYFPLFGSKRLDYFDWCQGVELVAKGNHQTTQALASMKDFKPA